MVNMKFLLAGCLVLLLIASCICAGCTGTVEPEAADGIKDSILGYWVSNDNARTIYEVHDDNTATVTILLDGVVSNHTVSWSKTKDNEYLLGELPFYLSKSGTDGTMVNSDGTILQFIKYDYYPVPTSSPSVATIQIPTSVPTETPSQESVMDEIIGTWYCKSIAVPEGGSFKWQQMKFNADGRGFIDGYDSEKQRFDKIYFAWTNLGTNEQNVNQYLIFTDNGNTLNFKFEKESDDGKLSGTIDGYPLTIDDFKHTFKE